jgi:hypothetical protein
MPAHGPFIMAQLLLIQEPEDTRMKYMVGWLLGLPLGIVLLWFVANQAGCGL